MSWARLASMAVGATLLALGSNARAGAPVSLVVTRTERAADCPDTGGLVARGRGALVARDTAVPGRDVVVTFDRDGELRRAQIATPNGGRRALSDRASDCNGLFEPLPLQIARIVAAAKNE